MKQYLVAVPCTMSIHVQARTCIDAVSRAERKINKLSAKLPFLDDIDISEEHEAEAFALPEEK